MYAFSLLQTLQQLTYHHFVWAQDLLGAEGGGVGGGQLLGMRVALHGRVVLLARESAGAETVDIAVVEWDGGGETDLPVGLLRRFVIPV